MLTLEETGWNFKVFKVSSILNIFPIGVDLKSGRIQRQSSKTKCVIWKILYGVGVSHWFYMLGRLVQSTILEPQKYFRWDNFILHFGFTCFATVFYFIGFCLFVKTPEENVIIFNQLFSEREDPVQKMVDQEKQLELQMKKESGNGKENQVSAWVNKSTRKSGAPIRLVSTSRSTEEPHEEIQVQMEVSDNESDSDSEVLRRPLLTWPPQYSLDELVAKLYPMVMIFTAFSAILILALDPSRPQLLYSVLPPEWQNPSSFLTLFAAEALFIAIVNLIGTFTIVAQILFFSKCQLELEQMSLQIRNLRGKFQNRSSGIQVGIGARAVEREIWILRQILKEMRELVVFIELFNRCYPFPIFALKICCLSTSIVFYFFAIRHYEDFPLLGVFTGYSATTITLTYTVMYAHAFSIPGKMDELKNKFLLTAQKTTSTSAANTDFKENKNLRAEMKREIKRIHGVGIKVGSFHQMERESTPNFVNFVVNQVLTLLVTFPR